MVRWCYVDRNHNLVFIVIILFYLFCLPFSLQNLVSLLLLLVLVRPLGMVFIIIRILLGLLLHTYVFLILKFDYFLLFIINIILIFLIITNYIIFIIFIIQVIFFLSFLLLFIPLKLHCYLILLHLQILLKLLHHIHYI